MANLEAQPGWPAARQLDRDEFASGGPDGNLNEHAKVFLARTEYLNQQKADKEDIIQGQYSFATLAAFNALKATIPVNSVVIIDEAGANQGTNTWNGTTLTKSAYDPLAQAKTYSDENRAFSQSISVSSGDVTLTDVQARKHILYFIGSLASDVTVTFPKFAAIYELQNATTGGFSVLIKTLDQVETARAIKANTRVTAMNSGSDMRIDYTYKADLNSPVFTGTPKAPTPLVTSSDTSIATTKLVDDKIDYSMDVGTSISVTGISTDVVLTSEQASRDFLYFSGVLNNDLNIVLPSKGKRYFVRNDTTGGYVLNFKTSIQSNPLTVNRATTSEIVVSGNYAYLLYIHKADLNSPVFTGTPKAPTPAASSNDTSIATTSFARRTAMGIASVDVSAGGVIDLTDSNLGISTLRFIGSLTSDVTVNFPSGAAKYTVHNRTTGGFNVILKGFNQNSSFVTVKPDFSENVVLYSGVISRLLTDIPQYTLPVATETTLGGIKVGSGLTVGVDGTLNSVSGGGSSQHFDGKFVFGKDYLVGQVVEHGSGNYEVISPVANADTAPNLSANYQKISHNHYAGANRKLSVLSTTEKTIAVADKIPYFMTKDGLVTLGRDARYLGVSFDYGVTWEGFILDAGTSSGVKWIKQTNDGELLIAIYDTSQTVTKTRLIKSTGWYSGLTTQPTWTKVFEFQKKGVYLSDWGFSQHNNFVLVTEYGYKHGVDPTVDAETYARYVYLSKDYGKTWQTIFDLSAHTDGIGVHMHGACFDQYWNRIWVSFGDAAFGRNGLLYSDDLGKTWVWALQTNNAGINFQQSVHIVALPTCILLASDSYPNGVQRIDRAQGHVPTKGYYTVDSAYMIPDQLNTLNHLFHHVTRAEWLPDAPYLFVWGSEVNAGKSGCVATFDGWEFDEVWVSSANSSAGFGGRSVLGVTPENEVIIACDDPARIDGRLFTITAKVSID